MGIETPRRLNTRRPPSTGWPRRTAANTPRLTPTTIEMTMANSASSIVAGKYCLRSEATGLWLCSEIPRLPCRSFHR